MSAKRELRSSRKAPRPRTKYKLFLSVVQVVSNLNIQTFITHRNFDIIPSMNPKLYINPPLVERSYDWDRKGQTLMME